MTRESPKFTQPPGSHNSYRLVIGPASFQVLACIARHHGDRLRMAAGTKYETALRNLKRRQYVDDQNQLTVYGKALWTLLSPLET